MIKDLMVHLDGSGEDEARLSHAEALSSFLGGARVTGLYTNLLPEYAYVLGAQSGYGEMEAVFALEKEVRDQGDRATAKITERLFWPGGSNEMRRIETWPSQVARRTVSLARCADLFIATTPYRPSEGRDWTELVEAVLFEAGRGVYLIPPGCPARQEIRTVLLAWNDSRSATRAICEALPLLKRATLVRLLSVEPLASANRGEEATDIAAHLDRHGVKVEIVPVQAKDEDTGAAIRDEAAKLSADVIVMGAYGHSRFREWVLGGATRDLIEKSERPLFLAH
ncbi:MAG: universal stress protein [Beijerinckiaceae bacterium]|nr:universal stress protein [Beijerinckiaceae bacterium]